MIKKMAQSFCAIIFYCVHAMGQSTPVVVDPQVPWLNNNPDKKDNATATGLIQKNLFTGVANINVPLLNYSNGGVDLSVGLNYVTDGMKVDRIASNIGLGWELYTGAVIERQIVGVEDDIRVDKIGTVFYYPYPERIGYWFNNTDTNKQDQGPDFFALMLNGKKISFLFSKTGDLLTIPKSKIKVERYLNGIPVSGSINTTSYTDFTGDLSFVVTDENGNEFYFKKGYQATETNKFDLTSQGLGVYTQTYYPVDKWFLDKVITYEGQQTTYTYDEVDYTELQHKSQVYREVNNNWSKTEETRISKKYATQQIRKISYPNNIDVEFNYDNTARCDLPSAYRLKEVIIKERTVSAGATPQSIKYAFNQAYFVSPDSTISINFSNYPEYAITANCGLFDHTRFRLKLKSIDMIAGGQTKNYYSFGYSSVNMPPRISGGRDLYGYPNSSVPILQTGSNGTFALMVALHNYPDNTHYAGMDLTPDFSTKYSGACMLNKITSGAGAEYELTYGANTNTINGLGGLRLDKIKLFDGYNHDNDAISTFDYADPEKFLNEKTINYTCDQESGPAGYPGYPYYTNNIWSNSHCLQNTAVDGYNYGYKKVTENIFDANLNLLKKTINYFSGSAADPAINNGQNHNRIIPANNNNDPDFYKSYGTPPFANKQFLRSWGIGLPLKTEYYDYNNFLLKRENFTYTVSADFKQDDNYKAIAKLPSRKKNTDIPETYYRDVYYPTTGSTLLQSTTTQDYTSSSNYIEKTVNFEYDSRENNNSINYKNSLGQTVKINTYYNYNWNGASIPGNAITKLNQDNLEQVIYSDTWKSDIENNGDAALSLVKLAVSGLTIVSNNIIRPQYGYQLAADYPLSTGAYSDNSTLDMNAMVNGSNAIANFRKVSENSRFDDMGYLIESKDPILDKYNAFIMDNETGNKLAQVSNAKYEEIAYCGFESNYTTSGIDYKKGNLVFDPANIVASPALLGRLAYKISSSAGKTITTSQNLSIGKKYTVSLWVAPGGVIQVNDGVNVIGLSAFANYNGWTLYQTDFLANANSIHIWGEGIVDEIRVYPSNAQMTNDVYLPLCGKTASVDVNSKIVTYEYDAFGRQTLVRDQDGNIMQKIVNVDRGND